MTQGIVYRTGEDDDDPWNRKRHDEPPGLDEIFNDMFSGKGDPGKYALPLSIALSLLFLLSGFFIVAPAEKAVIVRLGKVVRIAGPGPNWVIPVVERRHIVNVHAIGSYNYNAEMLTSDESYADVDVSVFYRVKNPELFLYSAVDPVDSLAQATASALRQVVGNTKLEGILTDGRISAREQIHAQIEKIIDSYNIGLEITDTKLQDAKPPQPVKAAFDDVIQAREDYDRYVMDAEGYRNNIVPKAEGQRMRIENHANAEYEQVLMDAHAQVAGFDALVPEYRRQPDIIRDQLFVATMRSIYGRTKKIFLANDANLSLLPLDKVMGQTREEHEDG